jgi:hypothetical protein
MTTTQILVQNNDYNSYIEINFRTDYINDVWTSDFDDFSMLIAKTNSTDITCESCSADFNLATPFYTIDHSVAFCLSHVPTAILDEIKIIL